MRNTAGEMVDPLWPQGELAGIPGEPANAADMRAPAAGPEPIAAARLIELEAGLHAIAVGELGGTATEFAGMSVPAVQVCAAPSSDLDPVEIIAASGDLGSWLGPEGGTVVVRAPPGGGRVLVTVYGMPDRPLARPALEIHPLDRLRQTAPGSAPIAGPFDAPPESRGLRELRFEIQLHIERMGDRRFPGQGWVGNRGQKLRIEAFSIEPLEVLRAGEVEYKAFAPDGRETPWVAGGKLCGTRGRGLPLTGFALRLAPQVADRFDIVYQGAFFAGGLAGPKRNGEVCASPVPDDPLEAMNVRIVERTAP